MYIFSYHIEGTSLIRALLIRLHRALIFWNRIILFVLYLVIRTSVPETKCFALLNFLLIYASSPNITLNEIPLIDS